MGKESNNVTRTTDVATDNSEVELYLDTDVLAKEIEHFNWLNFRLGQWAVQMGLDNATIQNSTSGQTSASLFKFTNDFFIGDFERLRENTVKNIEIMRDVALVEANKLRAQCEHFYEIVVGNGGNTMYPTLTPILYLDTTYYDAGVIDTNTTAAATRLKDLDDDANELYGILLSFHYREHLEDCSAEIESIQSDCKNRTRLQVLERAFDNYVRDVKKFNENVEEKFNEVLDPRMALDHRRTYKYPRIQDAEERARMDRIIRNELHEMGFTDKAIDNAIGKSSITLNELAAYAEKIVMEDGVQNNDGEEIKLVVSALEGNASVTYSKYGEKLADKAETGWELIAKYHMGLIHTKYSDGEHSIAEGYDTSDYVAAMNEVFQSCDADKVIAALKKGAFNVVVASGLSKMYTDTICPGEELKEDKEKLEKVKEYIDQVKCENAEVFRKNLLLYDTYYFIEQKMIDDRNIPQDIYKNIPGTQNIFFTHEDKLYEMKAIRYDNAGIHVDMNYRSIITGGDMFYNSSDELLQREGLNEASVFTMNISAHEGLSSVDRYLVDGEHSQKIRDASKAQKEMVEGIIKDSALSTVSYVNPLAGEVVSLVLSAADGIDSSDAVDIAKFSADKTISGYGAYAGLSDDAVSISNSLVSDGFDRAVAVYDVVTSSSLEEIEGANQADDCARLRGSVGACTITVGDKEILTYVNNHVGISTPGHEKTVDEISNGGGLKKLCNWDEATVKAIKNELELAAETEKKYANDYSEGDPLYKAYVESGDVKAEDVDTLMSLINGGYEIGSGTNYTVLKSDLEKINNAYTQVTSTNTNAGGANDMLDVYKGWDSGIEDICDLTEN